MAALLAAPCTASGVVGRSYCSSAFREPPHLLVMQFGSFDDLVGADEKRRWNSNPECFGRRSVDNKFEFRWLLDGKVSRFRSLYDLINIGNEAPYDIVNIGSVGEKSACACPSSPTARQGKAICYRKLNNARKVQDRLS